MVKNKIFSQISILLLVVIIVVLFYFYISPHIINKASAYNLDEVNNNILVLDLDNNGIVLTNMEKPYVYFDLDNDNFSERTGWIAKEDGFLVLDKNNNNQIDNMTELFGSENQTGFEKLAKYDENKDKIINSKDKIYSDLKIWQDLNQDGLTNEGELKRLEDYNIVSIDLNKKEKIIKQGDNFVTAISKYTKNGEFFSFPIKNKGVIANIKFKTNKLYTRYNGDYQIAVDVMDLPWLRGYGRVLDIQAAISNNNELKEYFSELVKINKANDLYNKIDEFLAKWTNSESVSDSTRKLTILCKFLGKDIPDNIPENQKLNNENAYNIIKNKVFIDILAQTGMAKAFDIGYDFKTDSTIIGETTYSKIVSNLTDENSYIASYILVGNIRISNQLEIEKLNNEIIKQGYGVELIHYLNSGFKTNEYGQRYYVEPKMPLIKH